MVRVLIVAKTRMGSSTVCVGGLDLETNRNIRLLGADGSKQQRSTRFEVGQVWDINYHACENITFPHSEDVIVESSHYLVQQPGLRDFLMQRIQPWIGGLHELFDGMLVTQNRHCYITRSHRVPEASTGFWIPDKPLFLQNNEYKTYYLYHYDYPKIGLRYYRISYQGLAETLPRIPEDTLVRVSLARWWTKRGVDEERCYLQISGWYL